MKQLRLLNTELVALVDDSDYDIVSTYNWHLHKSGHKFYAKTSIYNSGYQCSLYLHRLIMGVNPEFEIDHINGDSLDCQRSNMRVTNRTGNMRNKSPHRNGTSRFKGVSWHKATKKWTTCIYINKKQHTIGYFDNEIAAALAYNAYALEHYGEFAKLNEVGFSTLHV